MLGPNSSWRSNTWLHGALLHAPPPPPPRAGVQRPPTPAPSASPPHGAPPPPATPPHASLPPPASSIHPTRHLCPLFGYAPKASLHLPGPSPHLRDPTPRTLRPSGAPHVSRLLALAPSALIDSERPPSLPSPPSTFPSHFSPSPSPGHAPPLPQRLLPRHPLQARLTCTATPVPALVRLLQLEGDRGPERLQPSPGGAGGGWGRAAPSEPPRPSAPRPPGTSASAARCGPCHGPPAACLSPTASPTQPPNPRCRCLSALRGGDRPPHPRAVIGLRKPRPSTPANPRLSLPFPRTIGRCA